MPELKLLNVMIPVIQNKICHDFANFWPWLFLQLYLCRLLF